MNYSRKLLFEVCGLWGFVFSFFFLREKSNISDQHLSYVCLSGLCCALTLIKVCLKDRQKDEESVFHIGLKSAAQPFARQVDQEMPHSTEGRAPKISPGMPEHVVILYMLLVLG